MGLERLERNAAKVARFVLRGGCDGNVASLPDKWHAARYGLCVLGHHGHCAAGG